MREREITKNKNKKSRFIAMAILIAIFGLILVAGGIFVIKAFVEYVDDNSSYHNPDLPAEVMSLTDPEVEKLIGYVDGKIGTVQCSILEDYPDNILKTKRLTSKEKMLFTIRNIAPFTKENCIVNELDGSTKDCQYVLYDEFNEKYEEIFGERNLSNDSIDDCDKHWEYNPENNSYEIYGSRIVESPDVTKISSFEKALKVGNMIELYEYVAYTKNETSQNETYSYTDHNDRLDVVITQDNYLDYLQEMDLYRYKFMLDKNGNYVWVALEYVNQNTNNQE